MSSKSVATFLLLCGVGAFAFFVFLRSGSLNTDLSCVDQLSESQIRIILASEIKARQVIPNHLFFDQLEDVSFGKLEVQINPDWAQNASDEYSASMYLVQFSEADFRFWALISSCGQVNMAGLGNLNK
jgi:hypothetical protein